MAGGDARSRPERSRSVCGGIPSFDSLIVRTLGIALLLAALGCAGCGRHYPVEMTTFEDPGQPVVSPDSSRVAVGLEVERVRARFSWWTIAPVFEKGRFDVMVYDLRTRQGPRVLATFDRFQHTSFYIVGWTEDGIYVQRRSYRLNDRKSIPGALWRVDPATGLKRRIHPPLDETMRRLSSYRSARVHQWSMVQVRSGEYFLLDPSGCYLELLFTLPASHERDFEARRRNNRMIDAVARLSSVRTRPERDSVRFLITTCARRPREQGRRYRFDFRVHVLDTTMASQNMYTWVAVPIGSMERWIEGEPGHAECTIAYSDLVSKLLEHYPAQNLRRHTTIEVEMRALMDSGDPPDLRRQIEFPGAWHNVFFYLPARALARSPG